MRLSRVLYMLIISLTLSSDVHVLNDRKERDRWHHPFWSCFPVLFADGQASAWVRFLTEPAGTFT